jgi:hypothetical protein
VTTKEADEEVPSIYAAAMKMDDIELWHNAGLEEYIAQIANCGPATHW